MVKLLQDFIGAVTGNKPATTTATGAIPAPEIIMTASHDPSQPAAMTATGLPGQADPAQVAEQQAAAREIATAISQPVPVPVPVPVQVQDPSAPVIAQTPQQAPKLSEQIAKQAEEVAKQAQETIDKLKEQFLAAIAQEQPAAQATAPVQAVSPQGTPVQQAPVANPLEAQTTTASPSEEITPAEMAQMSALLASIMGGEQEAPTTVAPVAAQAAAAAQAPVIPQAPAAATVA